MLYVNVKVRQRVTSRQGGWVRRGGWLT